MNNTTFSLNRLAPPAAMAAGAALGVTGVIQLGHHQSSVSTTVGIEHVALAGFGASLLLLVPVVLLLGRIAGRTRLAAVACTGQALLAALTVVSNVRGKDPSFFAAVAVPANLLWLGGLIALAVALKRGRRVPGAVAIGLPVTWLCTLPLSMVGGPIVAGAYWLAIGWMLAHGALALRGRSAVTVA